MAKDYANKQKAKLHARTREAYARSSSHRQPNFSIPAWIWMMSGILLGLLLAAGLYWRYQSPSHPQAAMATVLPTKTKPNQTTKKNSKKLAAETNHSRFDFYTVLPAMTMEIPSEEDTNVQPAAPANPPAKSKTELAAVASAPLPSTPKEKATPALSYIIQVGSFRQLGQAEELKAKLAFSGLQASIQTTKLDNRESRYRVYVGPFPSKEAALASQQQIQKAHQLNGLIVKINV